MLPSTLPVFVLPTFNQKGTEADITDPKIVGSAAYRALYRGGRQNAQQRTPYWSTINTWYNILDTGAPAAFVFAPTTMVPKDFFPRADAIFHSLNVLQSYDRFDLWLFNEDEDILQVQIGVPRDVGLVYEFRGMYGYLITRGGILRLLPHMLPENSRIDLKISFAVRAYDIKVVHDRALTVLRGSEDVREDFTMPVYISNLISATLALALAAGMVYLVFKLRKRDQEAPI